MLIDTTTDISRSKVLSEIGKAGVTQSYANFRQASGPILDVRSQAEFEHGHIPDALNFPVFTNDERAEIGISYKKQGGEAAANLGFDFAIPRLEDMVGRAKGIAPGKSVRIHCSRGGLRSRSVAWLLQTMGFRVITLDGGYKSYRRWAQETVSSLRRICLLSGFTGTGKTRVLEALSKQGEQVIDLEGLANHRGSSFGGLGLSGQPTTQHFENLIAEQIFEFDPADTVWIEAESGKIGSCWIPEKLYRQMKSAPIIGIVRPIEERLDILMEMYGQIDRDELVEATERIVRNLGCERTEKAVELIRSNEIREACRVILDYYDRSYGASQKRRPKPIPQIDIGGLSTHDAASLLLERAPNLIRDLARVA